MKYYGKSAEVCEKIIETFKSGNLPKALAPIFINRNDDIPSNKWSFLNRMVMNFSGTSDGRTFKQWESVGRRVIKGTKSFFILAPCIRMMEKENGEKYSRLYGFRGIPEFRIEDTKVFDQELWEKHSLITEEHKKFLDNLPLREVAEKWGLEVDSFNAKNGTMLGYYRHSKKIAIGVENISVWCHELVHAADHQLGTLVKASGQDPSNEVVAETGAQVLLMILGQDKEVDLGGAWNYIQAYSSNSIKDITKLIDRICKAVDLILTASEEIVKEMNE